MVKPVECEIIPFKAERTHTGGKKVNSIFQSKRYQSILAIICATGWSMAYPLIKVGYRIFRISSDDLGGKLLFAGIRFLLAGLLVTVFCLGRKESLAVRKKKDLAWLALLALVNTTLHYMFAYIGLSNNPSSRSTILDSMGGFFLIVLSALLFEDDRLNKRKVIGCLMGLAGIVLINIEPGGGLFERITFTGDGMILLNALCGAFGGIITRIVSKKMNMISATGQSMTLGGALLILTGVFIGSKSSWNFPIRGVMVLTVLVLISAVCFVIYNELLSYHPISEIAIYNALIPVLGVMFAAMLLREPLKWQYFASVFLVAIGIRVVNARDCQEKRQHQKQQPDDSGSR